MSVWEVDEIAGRGRGGVANRKIGKGEVVLEEEAVCHVVKGDVRYGCCQYCSKIVSENAYACNETDLYRYCSEACIKADYPVHSLEMNCLTRLLKMKGLITSDTKSGDEAAEAEREKELEPLRLVIRIAATRKHAGVSSSEPARVPLVGKRNRFQHLLCLEAATSPEMTAEAGSYVEGVATKMEILLRVCGLEGISAAEISHLIFAIQCNAHGVMGAINNNNNNNRNSNADADSATAVMDRKYATLAVGFFPMTSMMNHSCRPNCTHYFVSGVGNTPKLVMRAVRDIEEGEELMYSYVALYKATAERKAMLRRAYAFDCMCPRCEEAGDSDISASTAEGASNAVVMGVILSMQRIVKNSLLADKRTELTSLVAEINKVLALEQGPTVPSPYNESLFYAYNCVLQTTTALLAGEGPTEGGDRYSPTPEDRIELLKLHVAFGLLVYGAISKFVAVPQMETAMILLRIVSHLEALGKEGNCRVPVEGADTMPDVVKSVYKYCMEGVEAATVFKNSSVPAVVEEVLVHTTLELQRPSGCEGIACLKEALQEYADNVSDICKGVNASAW